MKRSVFHILWGVITVLQLALAAGGVILSRLAYSRGGVNHHVAFRKRQYNALIFTPGNVLLMQVVLILGAVLLLWLLLRAARQGRQVDAILAGLSALLDLLLLFALTSPAFQAISIYPYAVFIIAILFALELALLLLHRCFVRAGGLI